MMKRLLCTLFLIGLFVNLAATGVMAESGILFSKVWDSSLDSWGVSKTPSSGAFGNTATSDGGTSYYVAAGSTTDYGNVMLFSNIPPDCFPGDDDLLTSDTWTFTWMQSSTSSSTPSKVSIGVRIGTSWSICDEFFVSSAAYGDATSTTSPFNGTERSGAWDIMTYTYDPSVSTTGWKYFQSSDKSRGAVVDMSTQTDPINQVGIFIENPGSVHEVYISDIMVTRSVPIPEPSTMAMLVILGLALPMLRRR